MSTSDILDLVKKVKSEMPAGAFSPVEGKSLVYGQQQDGETVDPSSLTPEARDVLRLVGKIKQGSTGIDSGVAGNLAGSQGNLKYDSREQAIIDRNIASSANDKLAGEAAGDMEVQQRRQQRAYAEQAPPEVAAQVKELLSSSGDRNKVLDIVRKMTPEQREETLRLAPGIAQQLGDDRGGAIGRTLGALSLGVSKGVSQPLMELVGAGGTKEEIEYIRKLDALASQEFAPARPGDPWYEAGPLQAAQMAPWMATVVGAGGLGRAAGQGAGTLLARGAAAGVPGAKAAFQAAGAVGRVPTAIGLKGATTKGVFQGAGTLAGITSAAFPGQYAQEVDHLKEIGMEDDWKLRLLAGGTATVAGLVEGIVPNPFGGTVSLKQGAMKAARQYLWEALKKAPPELGEEYLQGVTSGLGQYVAQYIDKDAKEKTIADAFANGWEQTKEAALPMAFLLGVPAVGGAGLSAIRARRYQLEQIRAKNFVSESDAKAAGIEGNSRRERMANVESEIKQLGQQEAEASKQLDQEFINQQQQAQAPQPQVGVQPEQFAEVPIPEDGGMSDEEYAAFRQAQMGAQGGNVSTPPPTDTATVPPVAPQPTVQPPQIQPPQAPPTAPTAEQPPVQPLTDKEFFDQQAGGNVATPEVPTAGDPFEETTPPAEDPWEQPEEKEPSAQSPDVSAIRNAVTASPIGVGGNSLVYDLDDSFVLKVPKKDYRQSLSGAEIKEINDDFEPVDNPLTDMGIRVGQAAFRNSQNVEILQRQKGEEAGLAMPKLVPAEQRDSLYQSRVEKAAAMPQSAYDQLADTISKVNKAGYAIDPSKSNNVLVDAEGGQFNLVDVNKHEGSNPISQGANDLLVMLMGNTYAASYKGEPLTNAYRQIHRKVMDAVKRHGLNDKLTSGGEYSQSLAGVAKDQQEQPQPEPQDPFAQAEALPEPKTAEEIESLPKFSLYRTTIKGKKYISVRGDGARGGGDDLFESISEASAEAERKRVREQNDTESARKKAEAEKAAFDERSKNMPSYRDWRFTPKAKNSGKIVPNKVGVKFQPSQMQSIANWAKSQGYSVSNVKTTGIEILDPSGNRLDIAMYGAAGVKDEQSKAAKAQREADRRKADEDRKNKADGRKSASWITDTFGNVMGDSNRNALSDFLEGESDKFKGAISQSWRSGLEKVGALSPEGKVDWKKVKAAYVATELAQKSGSTETQQSEVQAPKPPVIKQRLKNAVRFAPDTVIPEGVPFTKGQHPAFGGYIEVSTANVNRVPGYSEDLVSEGDRNQATPEASAAQPAPEGKTEAFRALPAKSQAKFEELWNAGRWSSIAAALREDNRAYRAEFEARTGIKLPKTVKGTSDAVVKWDSEGRKLAGETKPETGDKSPAQKRDERLDELEEARLFNENFIKIVADNVSEIRKQDIYRLLSEVPSEKAGSFESWLIKRRPDLAGEINEVSNEILAERASQEKPAEIKDKLDDDQLPPSAIGYMMQGDRLKGEMWRSPTIGGQAGRYGAFYATNEEGAGKYSRGVGVNVVVAQMVELNDPLVVDTKQQAMEELGIDEDSLQEPSETQDIHHYIDIAIFEEATRKGYDGVVYKQEGYEGNPFEVHVFNPPDMGELPAFTVQGQKQSSQAKSEQPEPSAEGEMSVEDFVNAFVGTKQPEPKKGKKPVPVVESQDQETQYSDLKQHAVGITRTIRAEKNGKILLIEQERNRFEWSIRGLGEKQDIVSGIGELKRAKAVAERVFAGTFDKDAELRFVLSDNDNLAHSNQKLAGLWSDKSKESLAFTLSSSGFYTDGRIAIKVNDKDKDAILKKAGTQGSGRAANIDYVMASAKKQSSYEDNEMSVAGYRGGETMPRVVMLKNKAGGYAILDKAYHDTVMKRYPSAKIWGSAESKKNKSKEAVLYEVDGEAVAVIMPMTVNKVDKYLSAMIEGKFDATEAPSQPEAPPPKKPKSLKKEPKEGVKEGLDKAKEGAKLFIEGIKDAAKGNTPFANIPMNKKIARGLGMMAEGLIEAGKYKFVDFIDAVVELVGVQNARSYAKYLEAGWDEKAKTDDRLDKSQSVLNLLEAKETQDDYGTPENPNRVALGRHFYEKLKGGASYPRITDARKEASELLGGSPKDGSSAIKDIDESVEIGVVLAARDIAQSGASDEDIYDQLVDLYGRQPNLANRTSTSMKEQAYSTPAPLAFIANRRAGITTNDTVYDSSAGNGMLLIVGGKRYANELNEDRAESLRSQGVDTHQGDATSYSIDKPIDALAINPPFGTIEDAAGKTISWNIKGVRTDKIDHAISMRSLADIPENGKAVIVIAAKGFEKSEPKPDSARGAAYLAEKRFYDHVYDNYNVTDHFTVHGDLYRKQGASFPVDVIVISGKGKSQRPKPYNIVGKGIPEVIRTWEELKDAKLRPVSSVSSTSVSGGEGTDSGSVVAGDATATTKDAERVPAGTPGKRMGTKDGGKPKPQKLGVADGQPGTPDKADGKNVVGGVTPKTERTGAGGGLGDAGRPSGSDRRDNLKPDESAETDFQVSYSPGSKNKSVDTLIPRNHQAAVERSLDAISEVYGDIDEFVARELGYEMDEFESVFSAEQVDALAMAIARHKDGGAFIIGDQTGVGKGRAAAAMMVYANRNGMVPVFITEKPTLYADMIRDLIDIGRSTEDAPFNLLMTNALSGKNAIPLPDGRVLKQSPDAAKDNLSGAVASVLNGDTLSVEGKPIGRGKKKTAGDRVVYNAVFTTYSQLQPVKQMAPERARLLKSISSRSFFILDESHNAGGGSDSDPNANQERRSSGQQATITRAEIVRDLISEAAGLYFSSATYAKRPQTMGLYAKTGMTAATNGDPNALSVAIATGGVPLQQVVSEQLVESGMYLRRERSFDGVEFNPKTVDVDLGNLDNISSIFSAINFFDGFAQEAIQDLADEITSSGGTIAETEATGEAGLESTSFSSILHNLVDQMLLAVKADSVANEAIESIKGGESPVIYVDSTLEAALKRHVEETGALQGEEIDFSYKDLVRRYLERSREYTTRTNADDPDSVVRIRLTDQQLGEAGVLAYERAMEMIESFSGDMPASPIDWIRKRITDAGYSVGEITGRQVVLEYQDDGTVMLGKRGEEEEGSGGRTTTVSRFNSGELDSVLINQSGSTGISMHASEKFKNQKPRHMIIGQPARNIDTFMQSLGRVHRTGQVVLPRFTLLMTNAPAEIRPASVLMKKLASLNANVTASAKGSVSFDAPDVINVVGDQVVAEYLADNLELDRHLGELVQLRRDGTPKRNQGIAKKASGRMALRPVVEQKDFWDSVVATYDELISELNRVGKNPLLASTLDLNAKTIEAVTIFDGDEGSANLFMHPASIETIVANKPGKPMTSEEVQGAVKEFYGEPATDAVVSKWLKDIESEIRTAAEEYLNDVVGRGLSGEELQIARTRFQVTGNTQFENLMRRLRSFAPGKSISVYERSSDGAMLEVIPGFVTKVKRLKGGNPLAASKWMVDVAIASPDRIAKTALSRTGQQEVEGGAAGGTYKEFMPNNELFGEARLRDFDEADASTTEVRYVGVGNILAAYAQLGGSGGQVTFFTDTEGKIRRGVLMPRSFKIDRWEEARPVVLDNVDQAHEFLSSGGQLTTPDRVLSLMLVRGELIARAPKAKSKSGKYTINAGILEAASPQEFGSIGNRMEMAIEGKEKQKQVLTAIMQVASLQAVGQDKPLARNIKAAAQVKSQSDLDNGLRNPPPLLMQTEPDIYAGFRSQAMKLGLDAEKAGITAFEDFVAHSVNTIGTDETYKLGAYLRRVGEIVGMTGVRPVKDILGVPMTPEEYVQLAKEAFAGSPQVTPEQVEAGIEAAMLTGLPQMAAGFAPAGSPVPRQGLMQGGTQTDTPAFKAWFGDSKVVDEDGNPLVVYHGTAKTFDEFYQKDDTKSPSKLIGFFFSPSAKMASDHIARRSGGEPGSQIYPTYLSVKNPYVESVMDHMDMNVWSAAKIKKWKQSLIDEGYDGVYIKPSKSMPGYEDGVWIAFEPTQIKSATGNRGTFDPNNPNMLMQTQQQGGNVKGWTKFISGTRALIGATSKADISTVIHEYAHVIRRFLLNRDVPQDQRIDITDEEIAMLEEKCGVKDGNWDVPAEEKFAKMWEQYFFEGKSPNALLDSLFEKISRWMQQVYQSAMSITGGTLDPEVRKLFDKMVQRQLPADQRTGARSRDGGKDKPPIYLPVTSDQWGDNLTSLANAAANATRERLKLPSLTEPASEGFQEWLDAAVVLMRNDPTYANRLVKELQQSSRSIDDVDVAVLNLHYRHLKNLSDAAANRLFKAIDDKQGDVAIVQARRDSDALINEIEDFTDMTKKVGTEAGRALVARKIALAEDYTLGNLLLKARVANAGQPLSEAQLQEVRELADKIAKLEGDLAKEIQEKDDLARKLAAKESIDDTQKQVGKPVRNTATNRAVKKVESFVNKFVNIFGKLDDTTTLQQTEDEAMAEDGEEVIKSFVEAGVYSFGEFMSKFKAVIKGDVPVAARSALRKAWDKLKAQGDIPAPDMSDERQTAELRRLAKMVERNLVEFGITDPEEVIDGVHEALQEVFEDVTRREAMDAMSGYGQYSTPSQEPVDKIIRDLNAQYQQMAKKDDMQQGIAPKKSGRGRDEPSPELRELIREVNEMKRNSKYFITDPEAQLKTIFQATRTALRNRIYDLNKAIKTKEPIPGRTPNTFEGEQAKEIESLRKRRDELMADYKATFPKPGLTFEQRAAIAERAVDREITKIEQQLASGNVAAKERAEPVSTPALKDKQNRLESLRAQREAVREMQMTDADREQRAERLERQAEKAYVANLLNRIADYEDRKAQGYFGPKPKKEPRTLSPREVELSRQLVNLKDEFFRYAAEYRLKNMGRVERAWDNTKETMNLSRAIMTSFDLSAVFRQGGIASLAHPRLAAAASREMWDALRNQNAEFDTMDKIENDALYAFAMQCGLPITTDKGKIQRQEEAYAGRMVKYGIGKKGTKLNTWSKWALRPVTASGRAYTTFLNSMRFRLFKYMVSNLGAGGAVTVDEGKVIASYISAATGRADLGKFNQAAANLNTVFFAPRYVASRFQYLAMPFYLLPSTKVSGRVKKMIAMEYARHAMGLAAFLGLSVALASLLTDDEEEKPTVEFDPRSSDFMKLKIGDTRIDPMAGLSQTVTLIGQMTTGQKKGLRGDIKDLYGENRKFGDPDLWDVGTGFLRKKLAPIPGAIVDLRVGENVIGEKETVLSTTTDLFVPLSFQEAGETMKARGLVGGSVVTALSLLGMGGGTYGPKTQYATADAAKREELFKKDLENVKWDDPDLAYKDFLTTAQLDKFNKQREGRKQSLVFSAAADPKRKDYNSDETFKKSVEERDKALDAVIKAGMGPKETQLLLIAYYKRNYGSAYEVRGGVYQMKESLANRLRTIRRKLNEKKTPAK